MTDTNHTEQDTRSLSRRRVLAGLEAAAVFALAGCLSDDDTNGDNGGENRTDDNSGAGNRGVDENGNGDDNDPAQGVDAVGEVITGEYVSFMVEYVRPVEEIRDLSSFPPTTDEEQYGAPRTVDHFIDMRIVAEGAAFYGVGIALKNVSDTAIDAMTILARNGNEEAEFGAFGVLGARSQRLSLLTNSRGDGRPVLPGQLLRGEVVFALTGDPSDYTLHFQPYQIGVGASEQHFVELGRGSEATASFTQDPPVRPRGQPVAVGDFAVTLHGVERVQSIADSSMHNRFDPRPGYDYLRIDLSATRTSDVMIGQDWSIGIADDDGHSFSWSRIYQDVIELNRTRLEQLPVGESLEHNTFAFPVATEFDPTYLTMYAPGPFENPPEFGADQGVQGVLWSID